MFNSVGYANDNIKTKMEAKLWEAAKTNTLCRSVDFKNMNANIYNEDGQTPLMIAVINNNHRFISCLSESEVDIWLKDHDEKNVFDYFQKPATQKEAIFGKRAWDAIRLLELYQIVRHKARIVESTSDGKSNIIKIVIEGATCDTFTFPNQVDCSSLQEEKKNIPSIFKAIAYYKDPQLEIKNEQLDILLSDGVNVEAMHLKDEAGFTPLFIAISAKNTYAIKRLLESGADMYAMDKNNIYSAFTWSVDSDSIEIVSLFIDNNVDINHQFKNSESSLVISSKYCNRFKMVQFLLDNGANPNLIDKYDRNIIDSLYVYCRNDKNYSRMLELITNDSSVESEGKLK